MVVWEPQAVRLCTVRRLDLCCSYGIYGLYGTPEYAHGDLRVRNLIHVVALSADPLLIGF